MAVKSPIVILLIILIIRAQSADNIGHVIRAWSADNIGHVIRAQSINNVGHVSPIVIVLIILCFFYYCFTDLHIKKLITIGVRMGTGERF